MRSTAIAQISLMVALATCASMAGAKETDEAGGVAIGVAAGTTGIGLELTTRLLPGLNGRLAYRGLDIDGDIDAQDNSGGVGGDELRYSGDLALRGGFALLD
jgi:hypothetical protein